MTPPFLDAAHANELDQLLAQSGWIRALARRLTKDPHAAEDLVQETWIAALEHPKRSSNDAPLRSWLATVLRNVARQGRRGSARRDAREALAARGEAEPSAHEVVAGLALQQELARAVQALDEPYRSTLYQRFYEGLPPREIAKRAGLPVKTVKTRLERGLAVLRARLDREHGDRGAWLSMLVPWLGRDHAAIAVLGGVLVQLKLALAAGAAVACVLAALFVRAQIEPDAPRVEDALHASAPAELAPAEAKATALATDTGLVEREKVAQTPASAPTAPAPVLVEKHFLGRVIDVHGAPVPDVEVRCRDRWAADGDAAHPWKQLARTDASGAFDSESPEGNVVAEVDDDRWTTVLQAYVWGDKSRSRPTIVVARKNALGGLVLDAQRKPVEGAKIAIEVDESLRRELGEILDGAMQKTWATASDAEGRFALPDAPGLDARTGGKLVVRSPLHRELAMAIPEHPSPDLVIVLEPLEKPHVRITGSVVDPNEKPVADAWVVLGTRSTKSDTEGRFEFDASNEGQANIMESDGKGGWLLVDDRSELRAVKRGYLPAIEKLPPFEELELRAKVEPIVLRLGAAPLTIRGVVEDESGPVQGATIQLATSTKFGTLPAPHGRMTWRVSIEQLLVGNEGAETTRVRTDAHGRFELGGLLEKSYDLFVADPETFRHAKVEGIRAGRDDVVVRLGSRKELRRVAGHVVGKNGEPVEGVLVIGGYKLPDGMPSFGAQVKSKADGSFAFDAVAADEMGLQVSSEDLFVVFWRELTKDDDLDDVKVVVSRRCFVQIDTSDRPDFAGQAKPLNARGEPTQIMLFLDGGMAMPTAIPIANGKSEVVAVEEDTTTIVFQKDGEEVARKAVTVVPREKIVVTP